MKKIKSVMIIDDNEIDIFINQKTIESLNIAKRVQSFSSAQDALNYLKLMDEENSYYQLLAPQLILLDINMPIIDGFKFLDEFNKYTIFKQNPIAIFMLSSSLSPDDINKINNYKNVFGIISKPLKADKLIEQLKKTKLIN